MQAIKITRMYSIVIAAHHHIPIAYKKIKLRLHLMINMSYDPEQHTLSDRPGSIKLDQDMRRGKEIIRKASENMLKTRA